jgi:hypothetical protein
MLPGISAEDCLFADLGLDPGPDGCQSYEATAFLRRRPTIDTGALLILWQVTVLGRDDYVPEPDLSAVPRLAACLTGLYSPEHEAIVYEASPYPVGDPAVLRVRIADLAETRMPRLATLVVPPMNAESPPASRPRQAAGVP